MSLTHSWDSIHINSSFCRFIWFCWCLRDLINMHDLRCRLSTHEWFFRKHYPSPEPGLYLNNVVYGSCWVHAACYQQTFTVAVMLTEIHPRGTEGKMHNRGHSIQWDHCDTVRWWMERVWPWKRCFSLCPSLPLLSFDNSLSYSLSPTCCSPLNWPVAKSPSLIPFVFCEYHICTVDTWMLDSHSSVQCTNSTNESLNLKKRR